MNKKFNSETRFRCICLAILLLFTAICIAPFLLMFSASVTEEQALIREQGPEMFTRVWTRKESYLKFTGQGIRVPLNSFEVLPGEQTLPVFFQEFTLEGYRIALCSEEEMAVSLKFLTLEELLF